MKTESDLKGFFRYQIPNIPICCNCRNALKRFESTYRGQGHELAQHHCTVHYTGYRHYLCPRCYEAAVEKQQVNRAPTTWRGKENRKWHERTTNA